MQVNTQHLPNLAEQGVSTSTCFECPGHSLDFVHVLPGNLVWNCRMYRLTLRTAHYLIQVMSLVLSLETIGLFTSRTNVTARTIRQQIAR